MTFDDNEIRRMQQQIVALHAKFTAIKNALATIVITNKTTDLALDCTGETIQGVRDVLATVIDLIEAAAT